MNRQDLDNTISEIWERHGVFFAFSTDQLLEKMEDDVSYTNCGSGMVCPTDNVEAMMTELDAAIDAYHTADLAENGKTKIIWRELANHEAQIGRDITATVEALEGYGITREEVAAEWPAYWRHCVEHDYF